jgi:protein-S-isoprenylcysteine O-methyltransferase Ste14
MKLLFNALAKYISGLLLVGALLFLPAGGFGYSNGWLFIALLFLPMACLGAFLFFKSPALLEKRLDVKEKAGTQRRVVAVAALLFISGFIVAGLDFRFGWSDVSRPVVISASVLFLISYVLYAEVMRENAYLSRTIKVEKNQQVVDTGLYSVVRHPMYTTTIFLFLSIPLVLGSLWSLILFLPYIPVIAVRIISEEKLLEKELSGYKEYKKRVKYRLLPLIW